MILKSLLYFKYCIEKKAFNKIERQLSKISNISVKISEGVILKCKEAEVNSSLS